MTSALSSQSLSWLKVELVLIVLLSSLDLWAANNLGEKRIRHDNDGTRGPTTIEAL